MSKQLKIGMIIAITLTSLYSLPAFAGCIFFGAIKDNDPQWHQKFHQFQQSCVAQRLHPKAKRDRGPSRGGRSLYTLTYLFCCDRATDRPSLR